jgi:ABC-type uncharacterized transport system substrate-binding protein
MGGCPRAFPFPEDTRTTVRRGQPNCEVDLPDYFRKAAGYADKIVRGAKPADLPLEQPTRFKQVLNLKIAKALGLTIPPALLIGDDEVIE